MRGNPFFEFLDFRIYANTNKHKKILDFKMSLQGFARVCKGLQGFARVCKGLQGFDRL
ncbi:hypothetical protein [Helicobacter fennelliae]|uniref:hypothetical protein n=1 Tax=Helicobacter fennelliae TaxID=215 RepID=UPI0015F2935A|nr:hypothetical protein [Helicobacter fennelliae]